MPASNDRGKIGLLAVVSALMIAVVAVVWAFAPPVIAPRVNVRWAPDVSDTARISLEQRFSLVAGEQSGPATWAYDLPDLSRANIEALVAHPAVDDTHDIDRIAGSVSRDASPGTTRIADARLASLRSPAMLDWTALIAGSSLVTSIIWLVAASCGARTQRRRGDVDEAHDEP